jgi:BirA family biotin operon repressor/biotin-[acetyl-CoA-carboxylase] ligase
VDSAGGFDVKAVEDGIATTQFARTVTHLSLTASTSTIALEAAQQGINRGVWIADEQTGGRGRGGHGWHSAAGEGLYFSVLVTPSVPLAMTTALLLSLAVGLATQTAIAETCGLRVDIRWPNDLMLDGRKCGGILVETAVDSAGTAAPATLRYAVIGIGINVSHAEFPAELQRLATSLRIEGARVSRESLTAALLRALDSEIKKLTRMGDKVETSSSLLERFSAASSWVTGKRVKVEEGGGYTGVTSGLDSQGFLRVRTEDGTQRIVISGGVREI